MALLVVIACTCVGIRLEAATVAEAARICRRSGDDVFKDTIDMAVFPAGDASGIAALRRPAWARDEEFMSVGFLILQRSLEDICVARTAPDGGDC
jgi:hypothetical protein